MRLVRDVSRQSLWEAASQEPGARSQEPGADCGREGAAGERGGGSRSRRIAGGGL